MGLDGFSMGNLTTNTEMTAAQVAGEAEFLAAKESKTEVKKMSESAEDSGVKRKNEESNKRSKNGSEKSHDEEADEDNDSAGITEEELSNSDLKKFSLQINEETDRVELINLKDKIIVESIDADNLMNIMSKLNHASGIFVNKKV